MNNLLRRCRTRFNPGSAVYIEYFRQTSNAITGMLAQVRLPDNRHLTVCVILCQFFHLGLSPELYFAEPAYRRRDVDERMSLPDRFTLTQYALPG